MKEWKKAALAGGRRSSAKNQGEGSNRFTRKEVEYGGAKHSMRFL